MSHPTHRSSGNTGGTAGPNKTNRAAAIHKSILAERFRTKMCGKMVAFCCCDYEGRCMFAHSPHELRTKEQNIADDLVTPEAIKAFQKARIIAAKSAQKKRELEAGIFAKQRPHGQRRSASKAADRSSPPFAAVRPLPLCDDGSNDALTSTYCCFPARPRTAAMADRNSRPTLQLRVDDTVGRPHGVCIVDGVASAVHTPATVRLSLCSEHSDPPLTPLVPQSTGRQAAAFAYADPDPPPVMTASDTDRRAPDGISSKKPLTIFVELSNDNDILSSVRATNEDTTSLNDDELYFAASLASDRGGTVVSASCSKTACPTVARSHAAPPSTYDTSTYVSPLAAAMLSHSYTECT